MLEVVDASGAAGAPHLRGDALADQRDPRTHLEAALAARRQEGDGAVSFVAHESDRVGGHDGVQLSDGRGEDVVPGPTPRDGGGHPPQCRLFLFELLASRSRILTTADQTRRRIERDLHDGAQQRLVTLTMKLRALEAATAPRAQDLTTDVEEIAAGLDGVLDDLRETARGLHPVMLSRGGLGPALKALGRRSPVPVELDVRTRERLPEPVEVAAYYVVAEALTNAAKHAHATVVSVEAEVIDGDLRVSVQDDGVGGADPALGSGLVGLTDRVEALGGTLALQSPRAGGTTLRIDLPLSG